MIQIDLLGGEHPVERDPLGPRQRLILNHLHRIHPDPLTADEAGALIHERNGQHTASARCQWCGRDGRQVLRSKALRQHVIRRRGADGWTLRDAPDGTDGYDPATTPIPF